MEHVIDFFTNYVLVCAFTGWFGAQAIKCIRYVAKHKRFSFSVIMASGGMPSSHSATVCAVASSVGRVAGTKSIEFALAFVLAFIVMYDAAGVRRAAGQHAEILNYMMDHWKNAPELFENDLKELLGHTPIEVLGGLLLGIAVGLIV